ncbi:MAG: tetratricopeptide repeat protein [Kofleriaceae bacterium]|nr:tetratricopeptide repeat protein [Kofleriaceae bacterium]
MIGLSLTACWRETSTPPAAPAPVEVETRTVAAEPVPAPTADVDVSAQLEEAEAAFLAGDLARAEQLYQHALANGPVATTDYARYKLAWVRFNQSRFPDALRLFVEVAQHGSDARLRKAAGDDAARVYERVGKPQHARPLFERIDPTYVDRRLGILADAYDMMGNASAAAIIRAQITP